MDEQELKTMQKIVKLALIRIGIRCDHIGFSYLCYGVELVVKDPELLKNLCKGLYVKIGEKFQVTKSSSVERSIRTAIDNTFINHTYEELNKMFKATLYTIKDKPTASELIRLVAEYYLLGLYKEDN